MLKTTLSFVAAVTLVASVEANTLQLDPIVVTSNSIESNELGTSYATEIYTSKEIQASHTTNIYEFFNQNTSLITSSGYGNPFSQKLDIHGYGLGDGYQNMVITLNGRRLNNIDMTSQLLGSIPLNTIERIEILKGAGSVMYGDGANAAVINIITKEGNYNELTLYTGNYSTLGQSLYLSNSTERFSYNFHLDHSNTDGTRVVDSNDNRDQQKSTTGGVELAYHLSDRLKIHGGGEFTQNDSIYSRPMTLDEYNSNPAQEGSAGFGSTHQRFKSNVLNGGVIYTLNQNYSLEIDGSKEIKQLNYITYNSIANYHYDELRAQLNYDSDYFKAALGGTKTQGERDGYGNTTSKENQAIYTSIELANNNHKVSAGARYEDVSYVYLSSSSNSSQKNSLDGYELGYSYLFSKNSSLFAHYSQAYQAPDIDRFFNWGGSFNGFIKPMKSDTYTLGYTFITPANKLKLSAYYVDLENEIYYHSATFSNTNIDQSHKYGFDLSNQWLINEFFTFGINYNYVRAFIDHEQESGDDYSGKNLPGVSKHNGKLILSYLPNSHTTLSLTQLYRSSAYAQEDFANNLTQKQDSYYSTNVSLSYAEKNYEIFAKINNLFDRSNGIWINNDEIYPVDFTTTFTAGLKFIF